MKREIIELSKQPGLKVFNRNNDKVFGQNKMYVNLREIRMSRRTGDTLGMEACPNIVFLYLGEEWFICICNEAGSYHATRETKSRSGYRVSARYMSRALMNHYKTGNKQLELILEKTDRYEYKGKPVYSLIKLEE